MSSPRHDLCAGFTPSRPNPDAIRKVSNPIPVPTQCPNCGTPVVLTHNARIYGVPHGAWPWVYTCTSNACDSRVGLHPGTAIPLGTLANAGLRLERQMAKAVFERVWRGGRGGHMRRGHAYKWLAWALGIPEYECHFGWFDSKLCQAARLACEIYLEERDHDHFDQ